MEQEKRIVVLIDMDCFYCQVEEKLNPELSGKPIAVVQYNPWKGGGIIAVNYVARAMGVTRHMRGDEAKEKCPEIQLPSVPCQRGKADITKYREAGKEVAKVLQRFTSLLERASIDEAYLDITEPVQQRMKSLNINTINNTMIPNTYALGYDSIEEFITDVHCYGRDAVDFDYEHSRQLLVGAVIVSEIRAAVFEETGYRCSAGVAHNKILAKLVCGMNKPNKQTLLSKHSVNILYRTLPVKKVKNLGGKFGDNVCEVLKIKFMAEILKFSEKELQIKFDEKNGTWLYNIARGMDQEPVQARFNPKSIGCCKQFRGKTALLDLDSLKKWLKDLGDEIESRLETDALESNRTPKQMVVSFSLQLPDGRDSSSSRSYNFLADDVLCGELFFKKALQILLESAEGSKVKEGENNRKLKAPIKFLGISVGKFEDHENKKNKKIVDYFVAGSLKEPQNSKENLNHNIKDPKQEKCKNKADKDYILKKFFNVTVTSKNCESKIGSNNLKQNIEGSERIVEPTLDKQESLLKKCFNGTVTSKDSESKYESNNLKQNIEGNERNVESTLDKQESLLKKCLNVTVTSKNSELKNDSNNLKQNIERSERIVESTLDEQESFFAKFLNCHSNNAIKTEQVDKTNENPVTTPMCNFIDRGDNSSDTDYSSSTINAEINKSIALFEEDPDEVARVSNMRNLLTHTEIGEDVMAIEIFHPEPRLKLIAVPLERDCNMKNVNKFICTECIKTLPTAMCDKHADFHGALKLRNEDIQGARKEIKEKPLSREVVNNKELKNKKKVVKVAGSRKDTVSIAKFFPKIDHTVPSRICAECSKRVPLDKFLEHLDFHEAQKLRRRLNNRSLLTSNNNNSSFKRKRSMSPRKKCKVPCKPIDLFFR